MGEESTTKPQPLEHDPETEKSRGFRLRWLQWILVLVFLYLLSTGPAAKLSQALGNNHPRAQAALEIIYAPISAVADKSPAAARLLMWYIQDIWRVHLQH